MASATITAINGTGGSVTYADGTDLDYTSAGAYLVEAGFGNFKNRVDIIDSPGVAESGTKDYVSGEQTVKLKVIYVGNSEQDCFDAWNNDSPAFDSPCTLTVGSSDLGTCQNGDAPPPTQPKSTGLGTFWMEVVITLKSIA